MSGTVSPARETKLLPWTGALFVVAAIASVVLAGGVPAPEDETSAELVAFAADNEAGLVVAAALSALAGTAFVAFGIYLRSVLAPAGVLRDVLLAGTILVGAASGLDSTLLIAIGQSGEGVDPAASEALFTLYHGTHGAMALGLAPFLGALGLLVLREGGLPRWIGWLAVVLAVSALTPLVFLAIVGLLVISIAASVVLLRRD